MYQVQLPIGDSHRFPVQLVLRQDGAIAFVKVYAGKFSICGDSDTPTSHIFDEAGFTIGGEDFEYNTAYEYKTIPAMLKYLQQQNLVNPFA